MVLRRSAVCWGEVVLYALLRGSGKTENNNVVVWYQYFMSESTGVVCDL